MEKQKSSKKSKCLKDEKFEKFKEYVSELDYLNDFEEANSVFYNPTRIRIMHFLFHYKNQCDYTTVKKSLNVPDGKIGNHLKALMTKKFIIDKKAFVNKRPKTFYAVTKLGASEWLKFLLAFSQITNAIEQNYIEKGYLVKKENDWIKQKKEVGDM